jgi:hypothetical protein
MLLLLLSKKKPQTVENFYKFNYIQKNKELSLPLITYNLAIQSEKILKPSTLFIEQQF